MKKIITMMSAVLCLIAYGAYAEDGKIAWIADYDEALDIARNDDKPLFIFFNGADWSEWCEKLEEEVFKTTEFVEDTSDAFIFAKIDFPKDKSIAREDLANNKAVREKFNVSSFPTVVVVDSEERKVVVMGYRPGGGKEYADALLRNWEEYSTLANAVKDMKNTRLTTKQLEDLFKEAKAFGAEEYADMFIAEGIRRIDNAFFLLEKYRSNVQNGNIDDIDVRALRNILAEDNPNNENNVQYNLAVIDFQARIAGATAGDIDKALKPLITYLDTFGAEDRETAWRVTMTIAQVFHDNNMIEQALKYAQTCYETAPEDMKDRIAEAIDFMEKSSPNTKIKELTLLEQ
ncbi:MAG: thioredoxin family protein [Waddliaceae bacterium]|nr:thioredoxin family protein [Waddliaceae bacterium]MBT3579384.1 thioredoxin family protein [Waddliaceae bacterium]MBT4444871.1 thioredoxin family protein [Waddliaceae bacterium]MBT6927954.1 thioredoxin family protein [Waddliaceae bacterium]MBT7263930.1 thioredoxin family protein [Waddliaceae bacterium]